MERPLEIIWLKEKKELRMRANKDSLRLGDDPKMAGGGWE